MKQSYGRLLRVFGFLGFLAWGESVGAMPEKSQEKGTALVKASLKTQRLDMRLQDYTDPYGFRFILNDPGKATTAPLYCVEKDGKRALLLGSFHVLPLAHLPPSALDLIKGCRSLVTEYDPQEIHTRDRLTRLNLLIPDATYETWWLHDMAEPMRGLLEHILYRTMQQRPRDFEMCEISLPLAQMIYYRSHQDLGMEAGLDGLFHGAHYGFEVFEEALGSGIRDEYNNGFSVFEEHLRIYMMYGGLLGDPDMQQIIFNYKNDIAALCSGLQKVSFSYSTVHRNKRWMQKWDAYFRELTNILYVMGSAHLFGPDGFLKTLPRAGYRVWGYWEGI